MKRYIKYIGLPAVYLGVACLCIEYVAGLKSNFLLGIGLLLIVCGIIGYWLDQKIAGRKGF